MTFLAVYPFMAKFKREKVMIYTATRPCEGTHVVTFNTIRRISALRMVWGGGAIVICGMAINTFYAKRPKLEKVRLGIGVTIETVGGNMCTYQRKPSSLMHLCNVVHNP